MNHFPRDIVYPTQCYEEKVSTDDLIVTGFTNAVDRIPNMSPHLPEQKEDAYRFKSLGTCLLA